MGFLRSHPLYSGPLVSVTDWRCRGSGSACGAEEYAGAHQLVFTRAGAFMRHDGARRVLAEPASVLFFNRGQPYRVSHPGAAGDDCTVIAFQQPALAEALGGFDAHAPFKVTHAPVEPATLLRIQRLRWRLRFRLASVLEVEEAALTELATAVGAAGARADRHAAVIHPRARRRREELVEATKVTLANRPEARVSLGTLAAAVGCSPFHLTRVFRASVGLPVYQYLLRVRLATALERLVEDGGRGRLSALALDLGFSSHSHLTTLFRRTFGLPPSAITRAASAPLVRELRRRVVV